MDTSVTVLMFIHYHPLLFLLLAFSHNMFFARFCAYLEKNKLCSFHGQECLYIQLLLGVADTQHKLSHFIANVSSLVPGNAHTCIGLALWLQYKRTLCGNITACTSISALLETTSSELTCFLELPWTKHTASLLICSFFIITDSWFS